MNTKELIEKIEALPAENYKYRPWIDKKVVLGLVRQLDEPQKVVVPQFVADYIEFKKANNFHVYGAMRVIEDHYDKRVPEWFYEGNIEKFCLAWLDGYEVDKEKRYLVKVKATGQYLGKYYINNEILSPRFIYTGRNADAFTRKELKEAGLGWVFDCPGIEIEEVEE